ncbi:MAG: hypothetical protein CSA20_10010 [Deltaproteobacteria bacterium]|nr:MAG: hypothetical protein CSA20_10010 [Deltaproteobacteria bacterium]
MRKLFLYAAMVLLMLSGLAQATLTTIGTAEYNGGTYNLIWDDDNNGKSLVWLDYSNTGNWEAQRSWASSLDTALSVTWNAGVSVTWTDASWRLPNTVDGVWKEGYEGPDGNGNYDYTVGYNLFNSEMGHLYYEELGNLGRIDTDGNYPQPGWGLNNTGDFINLIDRLWYWSGTEFTYDPPDVWGFSMLDGGQGGFTRTNVVYGLAVRSGQVSLVPIPGAIILLGSGLLWVVGIGRKSRRDV